MPTSTPRPMRRRSRTRRHDPVKIEITHHHYQHPANEVPRWAVDLHRKLDFINERLKHMATDAQVAKLSADVTVLIAAVETFKTAVLAAIAKAQTQSNDPAIDTLDATVTDEVSKLAAATPAP